MADFTLDRFNKRHAVTRFASQQVAALEVHLPANIPVHLLDNEAMKKKRIVKPKFVNEAQEADWWASREGREFIKQKSGETEKKGGAPKGSRLVSQLNKVPSVLIALRLPEPDVGQGSRTDCAKGHRIPDTHQDVGA